MPQQHAAGPCKALAYLIASINRGGSSTDLRAGVELGVAPEDCTRNEVSAKCE